MTRALRIVRPLAALTDAERRIRGRDLNTDPMMLGEGIRYWTVERVSALKADNEQLRAARKARKV